MSFSNYISKNSDVQRASDLLVLQPCLRIHCAANKYWLTIYSDQGAVKPEKHKAINVRKMEIHGR